MSLQQDGRRARLHKAAQVLIRNHGGRFTRFGLVGASGVIVNFLVLAVAIEAFSVHHLVAGAMATECAIMTNFTFNDRWTFRDINTSRSWFVRLLRYHSVAVGGLLISVTVLAAMIDGVGLPYPVANSVGIGAAMLWNYSGSSRFAWSNHPRGSRVSRLLKLARPSRRRFARETVPANPNES